MRGLLPAVLTAALLVGACEPSAPAADPTPTADPALAEIRSARDALGAPMVALAEAVLALRDTVDAARHDAERGEAMRAALEGVDEVVARVRAAADEAEDAATSVEGAAPGVGMDVEGRAGAAPASDASPGATAAPIDATAAVTDAAGVVVTAAGEARRAADAAEAERAALERLVEIDVRLDDAAGEWATPGSQTQRRTALTELAGQLEAMAEETRAIAVEPEACPALREHRVAWALLLAERSTRLADVAASGRGAEYDELRQAFIREPFGESRRAVDAQDRACWREASQIPEAAEVVAGQVEELEAALNP